MKKCLVLPFLMLSIGCSDDSESARIKELEQQNQQLQSYYQQNQPVQSPPQIIQQPSQPPVVVQEHNDNGLLGGIAGFMAGHALGSIGNNSGSNSTHIVERHYETNRIRDMPNSSPSSSRLPKVIQPPVSYSSNYNNSSSTRSVAPTTTIRPRISSGPSRSLSSSIRRR
jgi:hypothetical protein